MLASKKKIKLNTDTILNENTFAIFKNDGSQIDWEHGNVRDYTWSGLPK